MFKRDYAKMEKTGDAFLYVGISQVMDQLLMAERDVKVQLGKMYFK